MGGSINVVIRDTNNIITSMNRWTNPLPDFIFGIGNAYKNSKIESYINDYLISWKEMKEDYENVEKGNYSHYKFNMTEVYAPYSGDIVPVEYGIVVIDLLNLKIYNCQVYSKLETITYFQDDDVDYELLKEQFINKKLKYSYSYVGKYNEIIDEETKNFNFIKDLFNRLRNDISFIKIKVDLSPFELINYKCNKEGYQMLKKELIKNGYKIDNKLWNNFYKQRG